MIKYCCNKREGTTMKFKLVYVGEVKINPKKRSQHLQDIRNVLSPQLKRLSEISPYNVIKEKLQSMGSLLDDFEIQHAEELLEELKGYLLDEEYENMLSKLAECIAGIDYEGGISCVNEYLG